MKPSILATLLLTVSAISPAAVIFANGTPDQSSGNSYTITLFRFADDFNLASASSVDSIRFWMLATSQSFGGTLSYAFYQDSNGALGSVVSSGSVSNVAPLFLSSIPGFNVNNYQVDIPLPSALNLAAGTYWLELHDGPTLSTNNNTEVYWAIAAGVKGNARSGQLANIPTNQTTDALAFSLYGTPATAPTGVPEPSTIAITFAGLIALGLLRK